MYALPLAIVAATQVTAAARQSELRDYARWEYGTSDPTWLIVSARRTSPKKPHRSLRRRLRYWINSFRGFAAFDVRGVDDRARD